ncbi:hypothetical protein C8J36_1216 [Rhizobium sp. PP-F2F-G48]|uniref:DUF2934 domain-containing protein n=1 Tax=Rhizobium sp. PP-F2F-G48 TaxID=2135651 RepID=UPI00104DDDDB|nr:DUF2934 domain-containing protein [Rhizobium sp. PP-F2F-G48]TCM45527.1 hypothetical protein C8J36_1216 [Rhizobium sp. PP-F2F-G48]
MSQDDNNQREKAYRIWEEEGRPEGRHDDHWRRAGEPDVEDQESEDVIKVNQEADKDFAGDSEAQSPIDTRPPSTISPD